MGVVGLGVLVWACEKFFVTGLSLFFLCFGVCFCEGWFLWVCFGGGDVFLYVV